MLVTDLFFEINCYYVTDSQNMDTNRTNKLYL